MKIAIAHDVSTKEGHVSIAAKLNSNFDGKLMLPSQGNPVATLVGSHRCMDDVAWVIHYPRAPEQRSGVGTPRPQLKNVSTAAVGFSGRIEEFFSIANYTQRGRRLVRPRNRRRMLSLYCKARPASLLEIPMSLVPP